MNFLLQYFGSNIVRMSFRFGSRLTQVSAFQCLIRNLVLLIYYFYQPSDYKLFSQYECCLRVRRGQTGKHVDSPEGRGVIEATMLGRATESGRDGKRIEGGRNSQPATADSTRLDYTRSSSSYSFFLCLAPFLRFSRPSVWCVLVYRHTIQPALVFPPRTPTPIRGGVSRFETRKPVILFSHTRNFAGPQGVAVVRLLLSDSWELSSVAKRRCEPLVKPSIVRCEFLPRFFPSINFPRYVPWYSIETRFNKTFYAKSLKLKWQP